CSGLGKEAQQTEVPRRQRSTALARTTLLYLMAKNSLPKFPVYLKNAVDHLGDLKFPFKFVIDRCVNFRTHAEILSLLNADPAEIFEIGVACLLIYANKRAGYLISDRGNYRLSPR